MIEIELVGDARIETYFRCKRSGEIRVHGSVALMVVTEIGETEPAITTNLIVQLESITIKAPRVSIMIAIRLWSTGDEILG